jgi:hypothetical protein
MPARWKIKYLTREEALDAIVKNAIKAITDCSWRVNDERQDVIGPQSFEDFVADAGVRIIAKIANSLNLDQKVLNCDIAEARYDLKKREESSG